MHECLPDVLVSEEVRGDSASEGRCLGRVDVHVHSDEHHVEGRQTLGDVERRSLELVLVLDRDIASISVSGLQHQDPRVDVVGLDYVGVLEGWLGAPVGIVPREVYLRAVLPAHELVRTGTTGVLVHVGVVVAVRYAAVVLDVFLAYDRHDSVGRDCQERRVRVRQPEGHGIAVDLEHNGLAHVLNIQLCDDICRVCASDGIHDPGGTRCEVRQHISNAVR